jgi:hypothetical protein
MAKSWRDERLIRRGIDFVACPLQSQSLKDNMGWSGWEKFDNLTTQ